MVRAQFKIQQMAFMIVAVFFFFILAGLFFISYYTRSIKTSALDLEQEQTISSLSTLINMPELTCGYLCLDIDKLQIMAKTDYKSIWPVASIKVYTIYPEGEFYDIYESENKNTQEYSTFVSLCKEENEGYVYDRCKIGKLVAGVKK